MLGEVTPSALVDTLSNKALKAPSDAILKLQRAHILVDVVRLKTLRM